MSAEKIQRAVSRLANPGVVYGHANSVLIPVAPLAALIEAAALGDYERDCLLCGHDIESHAPDCALMALVDAVLGEGG